MHIAQCRIIGCRHRTIGQIAIAHRRGLRRERRRLEGRRNPLQPCSTALAQNAHHSPADRRRITEICHRAVNLGGNILAIKDVRRLDNEIRGRAKVGQFQA